jgi:hypothetical protein
LWIAGQPIEYAPESIRLFSLCENMRWNHLPVAGGLYDQHPRLLEEWGIIFRVKAAHEKQKHEEEQRKSARKGGR